MLMDYEMGCHDVSDAEAKKIALEYERANWRVFRLPRFMSSVSDFFKGVRLVLPLDPPLQSSGNWNALADSLWEGIANLDSDKILIVWPDANLIETSRPDANEIIMELFTDLCDTLATSEYTDSPKKVLVLRVAI